ncbi:glycosyltransferase family 25 protein [[Haemophilus] ducreyi]|uniref:glycosyltransferase family 25 protein n=1 Tax=Haemophilus ducreyi TaxID=730 RepID=UPI000ACB023F|nr:glycosyltransferase family 25 protein [[Haemophilus] ducreyi]
MQNIHQHNYVISLKTADARRQHIIQEFAKHNIPFQFFDAITLDLIEQKAKEFNCDISNSSLTKNEIACALSHIALWRLAKEKQLDYICIFEDDIHLGHNASAFLDSHYIDTNVHLVKLEKHFKRVKTSFFAVKNICRGSYIS